MSYLLTYKFNQDHLETYFCAVRSRNGWSNNPSALQFMRSFRRLLLHARIAGTGGNYRVIDTTTVLQIPSTNKSISNKVETINIGLCQKYGIDVADAIVEQDYDVLPDFIPLSDLAINVVTYTAGFILKIITKRAHCVECVLECYKSRDALQNTGKYKLLHHKHRGGLLIPTEGVIELCLEAEKIIRKLMVVTDNKIPSEKDFFVILTLATSQKFYNRSDRLFPALKDHFLDIAPNEESHSFTLIKV